MGFSSFVVRGLVCAGGVDFVAGTAAGTAGVFFGGVDGDAVDADPTDAAVRAGSSCCFDVTGFFEAAASGLRFTVWCERGGIDGGVDACGAGAADAVEGADFFGGSDLLVFVSVSAPASVFAELVVFAGAADVPTGSAVAGSGFPFACGADAFFDAIGPRGSCGGLDKIGIGAADFRGGFAAGAFSCAFGFAVAS
ncbi:hypothetical protein [Jonesia quinghaiensis]|uniref:hypothetical protein n=1 Tax=Jonesia quinghaiensis TaxID=262806 RepID=UPI00048BD0DC|nr:hypothetical protein [Jonesia quinghaiensis]